MESAPEQRREGRRNVSPGIVLALSHLPTLAARRLSGLDNDAIWQPVVIQAQIDQVGEICLTNAHDRIGSAPVDLDSSISLRSGATGKDDVVDITGDLPWVFRLQNPGIADTDEPCGVEQIMKSDPEPI